MIKSHQEVYANIVGDQHDIFPTILHILGIDIPYGISGTHLFVPNDQRDPLYLENEVFIYNGIIYHGPTGRIVAANFELSQNNAFSNKLNKTEIIKLYIQAQLEMQAHTLLYEFDAQSKIIKLHELKNVKSNK
jgi:phosphoglycerol transferase MdoB-like AlkP superfamily enzyme